MQESDSDNKTSTHLALRPGVMVSHYRLIEKVGAGGMGEVYLADDTKLQRKVALKFLPATLADDDEAKLRFTRESQAAAALNHPNIIHIYEVGQMHDRPYFAMEYVPGESLHHFAHDDPQSVDRVVDLMIQLCEGLAEAHSQGVVHRDIKAANIVVDRKGRPRILDFGLATVAGDAKLTRTGSTLGTVAYMSPEQVSGKPVDQRSDLFSLGVVLYELLAGRTPFKRDSEAATLQAIVNDEPQPLTRYRSDVPEPLCKIVEKLLYKNPDLRYQTADGVLPDLRALRAGVSGQSVVMAPPRRKARIGLLSAVGAVVVLAVALGLWRPWQRPESSDKVPMIAVLPFENLGAPDDEYFADGMTDEITSRLAAIQGLGVISRTSAIQYKNTKKSLTEIGDELGANYILEGTVRWSKVGDQPRVRITPQLIRVADDRHLWANNYERKLMEVFEVQADIAEQIVDQLGLTLVEKDRAEPSGKPTDNPEAYAHYLKGVSAIKDPDVTTPVALAAIAQFDSALALDPNFALAYAYKAIAHSWAFFNFNGWQRDSLDHRNMAQRAAEKALELDRQLSLGHLALGTYYNLVERDYDRALEELYKARSEIHSDAQLISAIALVQWRQGRFAEAQANFRRVVELDPLVASNHRNLAACLSFTEDFDEALDVIDRAIALKPDRPGYYAARMWYLIDGWGDTASVRRVFNEASEHVNPVEILGDGFVDYHLADISADSIVSYYNTVYRDSLPPAELYGLAARVYKEEGQTDIATQYCDSARMSIEKVLPLAPDDYGLHAGLGLSLACLGEADRAIEEGLKAKELMSVDDCHW